MSLAPGEHAIGPSNANLRLRTYRQGIAAKAGHDLVLEATRWHGTVLVPEAPADVPSVVVEVDLRSFHVVAGTGGVKALTDADKEEIHRTMQKPLRTAEFPTATFRSADARIDGDQATLLGELTLGGRTAPVELALRREGDTVVGHAAIVQSAWGIKPYSGLLGALKLRDAVDLDVFVAFGG